MGVAEDIIPVISSNGFCKPIHKDSYYAELCYKIREKDQEVTRQISLSQLQTSNPLQENELYFSTMKQILSSEPISCANQGNVFVSDSFIVAAYALLLDDRGCLKLSKRCENKERKPGRYDFTVSEHARFTPYHTIEEPKETIQRGIQEELGLESSVHQTLHDLACGLDNTQTPSMIEMRPQITFDSITPIKIDGTPSWIIQPMKVSLFLGYHSQDSYLFPDGEVTEIKTIDVDSLYTQKNISPDLKYFALFLKPYLLSRTDFQNTYRGNHKVPTFRITTNQ